MSNTIEFTKVKHDVNGNPRYVCHFLNFINEGDKIKADTKGIGFVSYEYQLALNKARAIGGRKFHNKQYGGGIVFQSYNINETAELINEVKQVNTNFIKEWSRADFRKVERAILRHFVTHTYKHIAAHGAQPKDFHPFSFEEIDNILGLAYTSSGYCAEYGICNGGYLMANKTHHFDSFMINELGEVIARVQDENENEIYITL